MKSVFHNDIITLNSTKYAVIRQFSSMYLFYCCCFSVVQKKPVYPTLDETFMERQGNVCCFLPGTRNTEIFPNVFQFEEIQKVIRMKICSLK